MTAPGTPDSRVTPGTVLVTGLWFGLVTGLAEAGILLFRHQVLGHIIHVSWHYPWMAPLADALLFAVPGLLLTVAVVLLPRLVRYRFVVFVFLGMATAALMFLYPRISIFALALLAAGLAFQLSRVMARRRTAMERLVRLTTPALAGLVVVTAAVMIGYERWSGVRNGERPAATAPNVLLIILDTVRAANLSLYGYGRETTPALERFAARGITWRRAFSTAPWTLPSHASLLTGRWPHELSADWERPLDGRHLTLAEYFHRRGYATGGFVANVGYCAWEFGLDRGFDRYQDYPLRLASVLASTSLGRRMDRSFLLRRLVRSDQHLVRVDATEITGGFLRWVEQLEGRPFFAMLNYYDAHGPYLPPPPYDTRFDPDGRTADFSPLHRYLARPRRTLPDSAVIAGEVGQYDGALAYLDAQLGALFAELDRSGIMERTFVIITSDHGEEFGEHGLFDHGNSLYRPSVEVPLVLAGPGVPAGIRAPGPVSLRNVPATLVALATSDPGTPFPGRSLLDGEDGDSAAPAILSEVSQGIRTPAWYPVTRGDMRSIVLDSLRYIHIADGTEEAYRLEDDWERQNLADSTGPDLSRLRQRLREEVPR